MRIITVPEPARRIRPATREEMEAAATFALELTELGIVSFLGMLQEWKERRMNLCERTKWTYRGGFLGVGTRTFKWVEVTGVGTFSGLQVELRKHGRIPSAEWCEAIRRMPRSERPFPCAIAYVAWTHENGGKVFPCVYKNGEVNFLPAEGGDYTGWRWLVEA